MIFAKTENKNKNNMAEALQTHKVTTWVSDFQLARMRAAIEKYPHLQITCTVKQTGNGESKVQIMAEHCGRNTWYQKLVQFLIHAFALPLEVAQTKLDESDPLAKAKRKKKGNGAK